MSAGRGGPEPSAGSRDAHRVERGEQSRVRPAAGGLRGGRSAGLLDHHQSLYRINALCLWCCLAWITTITLFWYVVSFGVGVGVGVRVRFLPAPGAVRALFAEFTWVLPVLHIGFVGMLVLTRWWDFRTS
ncbi:integral membrane protein [Streptomyces zinciresistens K42]|uniref:Integral membrane protein n=1 Tax=Streptomyces zinciresistens K42 TaxID=700597 RepID=G2GHC4_9ACTN|nr:integral membrane protein [Streptomyces zinciresistens K42]